MKKIEDSSGFDQVEMRNHREDERQKTQHYIDHHNRTCLRSPSISQAFFKKHL